MYRRVQEGLICCTLVFLISCNGHRGEIRDFTDHERYFDSAVKYIDSMYISTIDRSGLSRKTILQCDGRKIFDDADYRICDEMLEKGMKDHRISAISIEKNVCFKDRHFDLVIFQLADDAINGQKEYYYYSFCGSYDQYAEKSSFLNIPLKKGWSLFIER